MDEIETRKCIQMENAQIILFRENVPNPGGSSCSPVHWRSSLHGTV